MQQDNSDSTKSQEFIHLEFQQISGLPNPQFRFQDCQEEASNYELEHIEQVSFSVDELTQTVQETQKEMMQSQRTELNVLQEKQVGQLQKTINFNIIVAGQSGTGKTTFINTILEQSCYTNRQTTVIPHTIKVIENSALMSRRDLKVQLTYIDLEGYTSNISIRDWVKQVKRVITTQFRIHWHKTKVLYQSKEQYQEQIKNMVDDRTHACLYFMNGLEPSIDDLFAIKNLSKIISVIPIIAKADLYTKEQQMEVKLKINQALSDYHIECYDCLKCLPEQSKYRNWLIMQKAPPFIMESQLCKNGVDCSQVWNANHSDLQTLQKLLVGHFSLDMIQLTDFYQHKYMKRKHQRKQKKLQQVQEQNELNQPIINIIKFVASSVLQLFKK